MRYLFQVNNSYLNLINYYELINTKILCWYLSTVESLTIKYHVIKMNDKCFSFFKFYFIENKWMGKHTNNHKICNYTGYINHQWYLYVFSYYWKNGKQRGKKQS